MHRRIKRVPSYDKVWKNIMRYSKAQQKAKTQYKICLKYILEKSVRLNYGIIRKEIDIFFEKVLDAKVDHVALSLDMFWWEKHKEDDNSELIQIAQYFIYKAEANHCKLHIYPWARWLLGIKG